MKPSRLVAFALLAAGAQASLRTLWRRTQSESENKRVQIVVDYADACAVSIRAGIPRPELYSRLRAHGATHISLPEISIARLLQAGRVFPTQPAVPRSISPSVGHWIYLSSTESGLVDDVVQELKARLPQISAARDPEDQNAFSYSGDLETIGEVGLGFEAAHADEIHAAGLGVVPRPLSYAWADRPLIDRTLAQAASVGDGTVAFDGDLILGHEMHLRETVAALARHDLIFAYFAESRHQRGDWFIAKSRAPRVVLAERMTPAQMIAEDFHSAAHGWAMRVRERGVRLLYVNLFRVVHATEPLECLHYVEHIVEAIEQDGFSIAREAPRLESLTLPARDTARVGLAAAGAAALAVNELFDISEPFATGLTLVGGAAPFALQVLDRPRDELERTYAPTYLSKILALTTAIAAPVAATRLASASAVEGFLSAATVDASAIAALSALTASADYQLRIEDYRGYDLDAWLPLLAVAFELPNARMRIAMLGAALGAWWFTRIRAPDVLKQLDRAHADSHTHHLSASGRLLGDLLLKLGPRPVRKWAWLAPIAAALATRFRRRGETDRAALAMGISILARESLLVGYRTPERPLGLTARATLPNYAVGLLLALALLVIGRMDD